MEKIIPAVSSEAVGPLGVTHLPRMWLKAILSASGGLPDGYISENRGIDSWVIDDLAIAVDQFYAFLHGIPTYAQTEDWVRAHAGKLDEAAIAAHNVRLRGYDLPEKMAVPKRAALGVGASVTNAVMLNDLDDFAGLHAVIMAQREREAGPLIPLVSMQGAGPLGIRHLPRLWAKALLHGATALPDPSVGGVDAALAQNLGIDSEAMQQYLLAENPTYLTFEDWILANATKMDAASIAAHNAGPWVVDGARPAAVLARIGYAQMTSCHTFIYNDLVEWDAIRQQILAGHGSTQA